MQVYIEAGEQDLAENLLTPFALFRLLFWGTGGSNPYVGRSDMDGTSITKIVTDGVRSIWSMSVYEPRNRIYWLDRDRRVVASVSLDGTEKTVMLTVWERGPELSY